MFFSHSPFCKTISVGGWLSFLSFSLLVSGYCLKQAFFIFFIFTITNNSVRGVTDLLSTGIIDFEKVVVSA